MLIQIVLGVSGLSKNKAEQVIGVTGSSSGALTTSKSIRSCALVHAVLKMPFQLTV